MGKYNQIKYKEKFAEMANTLRDAVLSKNTLMFERPRNQYVPEKLDDINEALKQSLRFNDSISVAKPSKKSLEIYKKQYDEILALINKLSPDNKINKKLFRGLVLLERYWYIIDRGDYITSIKHRNFLIKLYNIEKTYIEMYYSVENNKLKKIEILESKNQRLNLYTRDVNLINLFS